MLQAHALFFVLATLIFAATGSGRRAWLIWLGTFLAASLLTSPAALSLAGLPLLILVPEQLALLSVLGAALYLCLPRLLGVLTGLSALLASAWAGLLELQGLPAPLAVGLALAAGLLTLSLARRNDRFAPPVLLEEAMLGLMVAGLALVVVPEALRGWRSGGGLLALDAAAEEQFPLQALAVAAAALLAGVLRVLYLNWKHK